jgi:hypothetical protein
MTLTAESLKELSFILLGAGSLAIFIAFKSIQSKGIPDTKRVFTVGIATILGLTFLIPALFILLIKT